MNQSSVDNSKKKFAHSSSKIIFTGTFFDHQKIRYFIQCESWEVMVGEMNDKFTLIWKGSLKQKLTCISHCHKHSILYAGTVKGTIAVINLNERQLSSIIDAIDGQPILAMVAYSNELTQLPELIAINKQGTLRKYSNNRFANSVSLPFRVTSSISNKTIKNKNDIAMVMLRQKGKFPYVFSLLSLIALTSTAEKTQQPQQEQVTKSEGIENVLKEKARKIISAYQSSLNYEADEQVRSEQVSYMALSNSKSILAISVGETVTIYNFIKNGEWFSVAPDFKFLAEKEVTNIDIFDTSLLYLTSRGILTYDVDKRKKVARGLVFSGSEYDVIHWAQPKAFILYGCTQSNKMKLILQELKVVAQQT